MWVLKSLMVLIPRSMLTIGHLNPLCFSNSSWSSLNVMLCMDVRNLALYLQSSRRCVLVRDWLHLMHNIGPCELCFFFICIRVIPMPLHMRRVRIYFGIVSMLIY